MAGPLCWVPGESPTGLVISCVAGRSLCTPCPQRGKLFLTPVPAAGDIASSPGAPLMLSEVPPDKYSQPLPAAL